MSVEFVTGRPGAQAGKYINSRIGEILKEDPLAGILVISPRQSTFEVAAEIYRTNGLPGSLTMRVLSPQDLAGQVISQVFGDAIDPVDTAGKSMAIRRILDQNEETLHAFARTGAGHELPSLIAKQMTQLHVMDVSADELKRYAEQTGNKRLADLAVIREALPGALRTESGERMDADERMDLAIENLRELDIVRGARLVVIRGFSALSAQFVRLFEAIMKTAPETLIAFPTAPPGSPDEHVYDAANEAMRRLTPAAIPLGLTVKRMDDETKARAPEDIRHVSHGLFSHTSRPRLPQAPSMRVGAAKDAEQEIRAVAAKIAKLNKEEGIPFSRMAIVWGETSEYEMLIRRVFAEANIPYFTDEQKTLAQSNLAEFILTAAELTSGLKKDAFLAHVASGFTPLTSEEQASLQNYAQARVARAAEFAQKFRREDPRDFRDDFEAAEKARATVMKPLRAEILRPLRTEGKNPVTDAGEVFGALENYLLRVLTPELISEKAEKLGARYEQVSFLEQSYKKAIEIVRQARDMLSGLTLRALEARRILEAGFEAVSLSVVPAGIDEVQAGRLGGFSVPEVEALFVVGVNDEVLPKFMDMPRDLLTHREWAEMLRDLKGIVIPTNTDEQKYFIVEAIRQAKKYIWWTYKEDQESSPSVLIQYLDELFVKKPERVDLGQEALFLKQNAYDFSVRQIRAKADGAPIDVDRKVALRVLGDPSFEKRTKILKASLTTRNQAIPAEPSRALKSCSASRLSTFYKCPYRHFVQYQLGVWVPGEAEIIDRSVSGTYMHGALNRVSDKVRTQAGGPARWSDIPESDFQGLVSQALAEEAEETIGTAPSDRTRAVLGVLDPEIRRAAGMLRDQYAHGELLSILSEKEFHVLDGALRGVIDRVDSAVLDGQRYYSIVDYKSSGKDFRLEEVLAGTDMQLTIYLLALSEWIRGNVLEPGALAGAGFLGTIKGMGEPGTKWWQEYRMKGLLAVPESIAGRLYGVEDGSLFGTQMRVTSGGGYHAGDSRRIFLPGEGETPGDLEALMNCTAQRVVEGREAMKKGMNEILPYKGRNMSACEYCEFRSICGFDEQAGGRTRKLELHEGDARKTLLDVFGQPLRKSEESK